MTGGWLVGLVAVAVLGAAAIVLGALLDRRRNRRRAEAVMAPPAREIPRFRPSDSPPHYLSELMARRPPTDGPGTGLSARERQRLRVLLDGTTATTIGAGYASKDYVTDAESGWAVLDHPRVLVCADSPQSVRELLEVIEKVALSGVPLVVAAPQVGRQLADVLEVNVIQRRIQAVLITTPDPAAIDTVLSATGARLVSRIDLQAGYVTDDQLGRCERWVSGADRSWILTARGADDPAVRAAPQT